MNIVVRAAGGGSGGGVETTEVNRRVGLSLGVRVGVRRVDVRGVDAGSVGVSPVGVGATREKHANARHRRNIYSSRMYVFLFLYLDVGEVNGMN